MYTGTKNNASNNAILHGRPALMAAALCWTDPKCVSLPHEGSCVHIAGACKSHLLFASVSAEFFSVNTKLDEPQLPPSNILLLLLE